jgi:glycosyltransferase involved in cell wall biosynthesis
MARKFVKIAVLATVTDFGGAERVVLSLINNVNSDSFELVPIIFTIPSMEDGVFLKHLDRAGKKYYKIFVNDYKLKYLNPLVNIVETYKLLKKQKFDLIHTHGYRADVLGIFLSKLMGLPFISTCHGFILNDLNLKLYSRLDHFVLRFANKIMAVSQGIKNDLVKSGIEESLITVIQNAVDLNGNEELFTQNRQIKRALFNIKDNEFVVGYIGRLSEEKGVKYLIEAILMLHDLNMPVKTIIIGEGPQRNELEDLVKKTNIEDRIFFTGFQDNIEYWLPSIDVFALPSLTEGTPMSLLEAMAEGIPVVASAVGGVPQVVDSGKNGILVAAGKSEEIKDAIHLLYKDEALRNSLSREAKKMMQMKYSVQEWINKIEMEYSKVLNK